MPRPGTLLFHKCYQEGSVCPGYRKKPRTQSWAGDFRHIYTARVQVWSLWSKCLPTWLADGQLDFRPPELCTPSPDQVALLELLSHLPAYLAEVAKRAKHKTQTCACSHYQIAVHPFPEGWAKVWQEAITPETKKVDLSERQTDTQHKLLKREQWLAMARGW